LPHTQCNPFLHQGSMARLKKVDLEQMGETYFESLEPERLVQVAKNLYELAVEQLEKLEQTSRNSSRPPSSDSPYPSSPRESGAVPEQPAVSEHPSEENGSESEASVTDAQEKPNEKWEEKPVQGKGFGVRKAGKQPGAKGQWRQEPLKATVTIPHYAEICSACNATLDPEHQEENPYMGYHQFELEPQAQGINVVCALHHYYGATCDCGHHSQAAPGEGDSSELVGRKIQLDLKEYVLVGPMLTTFIASLSVRYRLSRAKIQEFLQDWCGLRLSIGSLDRCVREAGFALQPVVADLIGQLQDADILHLDETPWYESGQFRWLWVAISSTCAVFFIGPRTKDMLLSIVTTAFVGWLISDGYGAYRSYLHRQRCLAHLIRKALALSDAVDAEAQQLARWLLDELRELIHAIHSDQQDDPDDPGTLRLRKMAQLGTLAEHPKLKALAKEILNDWDAMVAFVTHPELPVTNNLAERALRHAVIARRIGFGTRSTEGSLAYAALLSVIETCRLRSINPWTFIAQVITQRRKGLDAPLLSPPMPQLA
jgi:transposase